VRVAAYTQVLFNEACAQGFGKDLPMGPEYIRGEYAELAYKCGMYHQLGKALVPPEYQIWQSDFTDEEKAVYRKYTTDGRTLVALLQDRSIRAKEKRTGEVAEQPTKNIPWLMIRETCQQHMERWDGSGYPEGRAGDAISPIAQIVGLAYSLDRLSAQTKSENPFDEAMALLLQQGGKGWSEELIAVLKAARVKCRDVYNKYLQYTMTLPKTIPLVKKSKERSMGLKFRPMVCDNQGTVTAYEAVPWFGGIADRPGETETLEEVTEILRRTDLVEDVSFYFLYEAADAVLRMENCKLGLKGVLLPMLPDFYLQGSKMQRLKQLFDDQPIPKEQLMLTVPEQLVKTGTKAVLETLQRYLRNGVCLVLDDYHPEEVPVQWLEELGFTHLRLAPETYVQQQTAKWIEDLQKRGFTILAKNADNHDALAWLAACGVTGMTGSLTGIAVTEDELIRDRLAREQ
jgi:EAL domain-containing protein (putative c-di-GMP-specific phosphodiesterase class I)